MRVSVAVPQGIGADLTDYAARAEALGFHGVYCFDHLVPVSDPAGPALEAVASLGAVAAATERVVVGSLVLRTTLRPPPVTAGVAATLAAIAPGRVVVGLGAGDGTSKAEMARFGLPFRSLDERVAGLADTVAAVRATGVEVWVGGRHPKVVEVARTADGWNLWEAGVDEPVDAPVPASWGGRVAPMGERPDVPLDGPDAIRRGLATLAAAGYEEVVASVVPVLSVPALERFAALADHHR